MTAKEEMLANADCMAIIGKSPYALKKIYGEVVEIYNNGVWLDGFPQPTYFTPNASKWDGLAFTPATTAGNQVGIVGYENWQTEYVDGWKNSPFIKMYPYVKYEGYVTNVKSYGSNASIVTAYDQASTTYRVNVGLGTVGNIPFELTFGGMLGTKGYNGTGHLFQFQSYSGDATMTITKITLSMTPFN